MTPDEKVRDLLHPTDRPRHDEWWWQRMERDYIKFLDGDNPDVPFTEYEDPFLTRRELERGLSTWAGAAVRYGHGPTDAEREADDAMRSNA